MVPKVVCLTDDLGGLGLGIGRPRDSWSGQGGLAEKLGQELGDALIKGE